MRGELGMYRSSDVIYPQVTPSAYPSIPQGWKCPGSSSILPSLCRTQGYQCSPSVWGPEAPSRRWLSLSGASAQWARQGMSTAA